MTMRRRPIIWRRLRRWAAASAAIATAVVVPCASGASITAVEQYPVTTANAVPYGITAGPDGNLWFTENNANKIGRITPAGDVTEYDLPTAIAFPSVIVAGPDGNLWFTAEGGNKIGRITPAGDVTEFAIPTAGAFPYGIAAGPDGNLWFTEIQGNKIGRITPAGVVTEFAIPTAARIPLRHHGRSGREPLVHREQRQQDRQDHARPVWSRSTTCPPPA